VGKDPEAVVVSFATGDAERAQAMIEEIHRLEPERRHFIVEPGPGSTWQHYRRLRARFRRYRIGLATVLFTPDAAHTPLRRAAFLLAPRKILACNARGERHHLRLRTAIASWLFLRGVPLDRIFLRPWWLCPWKKDRSVVPATYQVFEGRPLAGGRRRVAVLSPYYPYPPSHGGAVRIWQLVQEIAREFDVFFFSFMEGAQEPELEPLLSVCSRVVLVPLPRYREPAWSSLLPAQVLEYRSPVMKRLVEEMRREFSIELLQVEYTHLATYGGDVLVEHDVTFDLYGQILERERTLGAQWNWWRWRRFETSAVRRFRAVAAMSRRDAALLGGSNVRVVPNGVDLERFRPKPEGEGQRLLFVGSFRHRPNVVAWRFFAAEIWPLLAARFPEMTVTVVAGPDPRLYWPAPWEPLRVPERVTLLDFVRDVSPLYAKANLAIVPTTVSAGTNLKVLEALASGRAVVSTTSGCAGLGLVHGETVWVADGAEAFAEGVARLIADRELRQRIARAGRAHAERHFGWGRIGERQRELLKELLAPRVEIRRGAERDVEEVARIQKASPDASAWNVSNYLAYDFRVAVAGSRVAGFLVARHATDTEHEVLNLAVAPEWRRRRIASRLLASLISDSPGGIFLEVRESNRAARNLYARIGFEQIAVRPQYYSNPPEAGIVMRLQS
jgi:ribosomal-protein-alanine acetyltransferase